VTQIRYSLRKIFVAVYPLFFVSIILNIYFIPLYSFFGAAVSTLISELLLFFLYALAVKRDVFGKSTLRDWGRGFTISFCRDL